MGRGNEGLQEIAKRYQRAMKEGLYKESLRRNKLYFGLLKSKNLITIFIYSKIKLFSVLFLEIDSDCSAEFSTQRMFIFSKGRLKCLEENTSVLFVVNTTQP